jgi:hypothetical protein
VSGQLHAPAALPPGKSPRYPFYRRFGGPQSRSGRYGEVKIFYPTGTRTPAPPGRPARSQSHSSFIVLCKPGYIVENQELEIHFNESTPYLIFRKAAQLTSWSQTNEQICPSHKLLFLVRSECLKRNSAMAMRCACVCVSAANVGTMHQYRWYETAILNLTGETCL